MSALLEEAMAAGALGFSTSRTFLHRVPDGRPVPGTHAAADELLAFADVLGRAGTGVFEGAMRLGERDDEQLSNTRAEIAWMGEASRRSGRPISFGLTYSDRRPDLYRRVIEFCRDENASGACIRPQTTAQGHRDPVRAREPHTVRRGRRSGRNCAPRPTVARCS